MNFKLGKTLLLTTMFMVLSYGQVTSAHASESWERVYPERFDTVEQFFLQQGCQFYQGAGYLYDLDQEHWLTFDEAASHYPELENTLTDVECELSASVEELSQLINIESFKESGLVLLYFDVARDAGGDNRNVFTSGMLENYQNRLDRLSEFEELPKYRIIPSRVGLVPQ
ncbi:hypothetical protein CWE09_09425 [Aliidiomarina minuta]|uniref:Uncharacterized protein n=1 Tax=Aliidiomarina minuta TaxID=880057 RepID=A0A432W9Q8_9GAMM|nr:hypothetical protein [Aliidiomarina minuta]RUO26890.1 hypothetical protein CWE09_09425 [Aliidiomarina minuta]